MRGLHSIKLISNCLIKVNLRMGKVINYNEAINRNQLKASFGITNIFLGIRSNLVEK